MTAPIFKITNGSTEIDLTGQSGPFCLQGWEQIVSDLKGGGVFQDSPIAEGSRLVAGELGNVDEVISVTASSNTQDDLIEQANQDLLRLLNDMRDYWLEPQTRLKPVYLVAKASRETNTRYALIHNYRIPSFSNPFHQPFSQNISKGATYSSADIIINRGQWMANAPGVGSDVVISSFQDWQPEEWESSNLGNFDGGRVRNIIEKVSTGHLFLITGQGTTDTNGRIYKSTNSGVSWSVVQSLGGGPFSFGGSLLVAQDGVIYAGTFTDGTEQVRIRKSSNEGVTWSDAFTTGISASPVLDLFQAQDGQIYFVATNGISTYEVWRGNASGGSWNLVLEVTSVGEGGKIIQLEDSRLLIGGRSSNKGQIRATFTGDLFSWGVIRDQGNTNTIFELIQLVDGSIIYVDSGAVIYKSNDNAITWTLIEDITGSAVTTSLNQITSGRVYLTLGNSNIYFSDNFGNTWIQIITSGSQVASFLETSTGILWAGADDELLTRASSIVLGNYQKVFVSNKRNQANLTDIKLFNSTDVTFTNKFPIVSSFDLFPSTIEVGDIVYFGMNSTLVNTGTTFANIVFNITQINTGLTFTWEYYNGSWVSLTLTDNTNVFNTLGINTVNFEPPVDWTIVTIDTTDAYWVRLVIATKESSPTSPIQANDQIYTVVQPYIECSISAIGGDIKALANLEIRNVSDLDGVGGGGPPLYDNRILTGTKIIDSDNENFTMFINASTLQNLAGIITTVGTNTVVATNIVTPSTEETIYTPLGTEVLDDRLTFTLSTTIARNFYGTYRLFLRGQQVGGSSGDIFMTAVIQSGSGGIKKTTEQVVFPTNEDWSLIDFGKVEIPVSSNILSTELADVVSITIQAGSVDATPVLHIYDIALLPVDGVWSGDFIDRQNLPGFSEIKNNYSLNLDSISNPKGDRSVVVNESTGFITAEYQAISTPPRLPNNKRFRQYFLAAIYGPLGEWVSLPSVVHCINLQATPRYQLGRGSR